jgi:cytochrome c
MKKILVAFAALSVLAASPAFAEGDAVKGKKVFKKCKACHMVGENAKKKVGPPLNNIIGAIAGKQEGFKYSKAMIAKGEEGLVWNEETLAEFLKKPKAFVPKTKMTFAGLKKKKKKIDNVIAYLKTFSK